MKKTSPKNYDDLSPKSKTTPLIKDADLTKTHPFCVTDHTLLLPNCRFGCMLRGGGEVVLVHDTAVHVPSFISQALFFLSLDFKVDAYSF